MGALYPKPKERYERWRLNENSPLYSSTVFLFIASPHLVTGSCVRESGPFSLASTPQNFTPMVSFQPDLGRYAMYFPGTDTQKLLFTPTSRVYSGEGPVSILATWRFNTSTQDGYVHLGGIRNDASLWVRDVTYSSWCVRAARYSTPTQYRTYAPLTSFEDRWNVTAFSSLPSTNPVLIHNRIEYTTTNNIDVSMTQSNISLGAYEFDAGNYEFKGWIADFAIFKTLLSKPELFMLSEPDNHDYRIGGVPLLLPERARFWAARPIVSTINKVPWHLLIKGVA